MNRLRGRISAIESSGELSRTDIECGDTVLTAYLMGGVEESFREKVGSEVWVLFKESEVALAKDFSGQISLRNRFEGRIESIERGDLLAQVTIGYGNDTIVSIISRRACDAMKLQVGESVTALVKANEITLMECS
ncbi:molybdate-binding domain of ModE [Hydrogenimonas sp.]|nr:molybdate-binding domain of ModE [Hydrogenimonas sp.]